VTANIIISNQICAVSWHIIYSCKLLSWWYTNIVSQSKINALAININSNNNNNNNNNKKKKKKKKNYNKNYNNTVLLLLIIIIIIIIIYIIIYLFYLFIYLCIYLFIFLFIYLFIRLLLILFMYRERIYNVFYLYANKHTQLHLLWWNIRIQRVHLWKIVKTLKSNYCHVRSLCHFPNYLVYLSF